MYDRDSDISLNDKITTIQGQILKHIRQGLEDHGIKIIERR